MLLMLACTCIASPGTFRKRSVGQLMFSVFSMSKNGGEKAALLPLGKAPATRTAAKYAHRK